MNTCSFRSLIGISQIPLENPNTPTAAELTIILGNEEK
jgi:hypothetical protein